MRRTEEKRGIQPELGIKSHL